VRGFRVDFDKLVAAVAGELRDGGAAWPETAALALCLRGLTGQTVADFAARLGVRAYVVVAVERGEVAGVDVPLALRQWAPLVDWSALDWP
jgi:hypothetical protein